MPNAGRRGEPDAEGTAPSFYQDRDLAQATQDLAQCSADSKLLPRLPQVAKSINVGIAQEADVERPALPPQ